MMKSIYGKLICGFLITIIFSFSVAGYVALRSNYDQIEDMAKSELNATSEYVVGILNSLDDDNINDIMNQYAISSEVNITLFSPNYGYFAYGDGKYSPSKETMTKYYYDNSKNGYYDVRKNIQSYGSKTNIKDISLSQLRENIGIVLQENILFSGTIESNIRFGNENASKDMIVDSAVNAQAYEFINNKEDKFDSEVEQRAKNLSGGQKQRLSIARTLIRNPKIFIMDDSSSALDMATEAKLQNSIKETMKDSTVIVIAQRISGVMDADKIIVMDDGKIANMGTHKELLKTSEIYRSIAVSQLGEEVLESVG